MDHAALVNEKVEAGAELVKALDQKRFAPDAALWFYFSDLDSWKLVLASKSFDGKNYEKAFHILAEVLNDPKLSVLNISDMRVMGTSDPLIKGLAGALDFKGLNKVYLTQNYLNGVYVEDAVAYRLTH